MAPKKREGANFDDILQYIVHNKYPANIRDSGRKKNFRRQASKFTVLGGSLHKIHGAGPKSKVLKVISEREEQLRLVKAIHEGVGDSLDLELESKSQSGHVGQDKTECKIMEKFWWPGMRDDVRSFISTCDVCQRRNRLQKVTDSMRLPPHPLAWKQISVDTFAMPASSDGYTCLVVAVDYFTKWIEAEALIEKNSESVADFLYKLVCRHGCSEFHINDSGKEFVDGTSDLLHHLTGVRQKVTGGAYLPPGSDDEETDNMTVQIGLLKFLSDLENVKEWPRALHGALFALRTSQHPSTKLSPFLLLYGRNPKLPIDVLAESQTEELSSDQQDSTPERLCCDEQQELTPEGLTDDPQESVPESYHGVEQPNHIETSSELLCKDEESKHSQDELFLGSAHVENQRENFTTEYGLQ